MTTKKRSAITEKPVWFITGCSTGFGRELAKYVLERGYRTVVTARHPDEVADLAVEGNALVLKLDVTNQGQIAAAIKAAEKKFGHIDVLVNNAGIGYFAAIEESEEKEVRRMFEINVFGLSRMINATLPGMRRRRQGFIVNFSSVGGLRSFPSVGYYSATEFAVEGLSEALWQEVEPLGIKVMLVEPSGRLTITRRRRARGENKCAPSPANSRVIRFERHTRSSKRSSPQNRRTIFFLATMLTKALRPSSKPCARTSLRGKWFRAGPIFQRKSTDRRLELQSCIHGHAVK